MIERTHPKLSVGAQCQLHSISRSTFYYTPRGETAINLDLMLLVDKQFLYMPFYGVRQMTWHLQNEGHAVNEKRIRRLMRLMRLMPIRCPAGHCEAISREGTRNPIPASPRRGTRPTPIFWAG